VSSKSLGNSTGILIFFPSSREIYSTMAALMKGYPINALDPVSKKVLVDLYEELMSDVRSEVGMNDLEKMHEVFLAQGSDPLPNLGLEHTMLDSDLNPLQMSLELLQRRDDILERNVTENDMKSGSGEVQKI
jgi:hypothetical protein